MELVEKWHAPKTFFVFDLEFIGDVRNLKTCKIWEIAVFSVRSNQWFEAVIDPDPALDVFPDPPIPEIPKLTREFLNSNSANTWPNVFEQLHAWVETQSMGTLPVFISHNTFRADKPILELECRRFGKLMPSHWYFFDSLHYSRRVVKNTSGNYSLSGLHQQLFNAPIENAHRAKADVVACIKIMSNITKSSWEIEGPIYPVYTTALRTIRWIGQRAEELLYNKNIRSVEDLYALIQKNARRDRIQFRYDFPQSVLNTVGLLMENNLPQDNINNIAQVISTNPNIMTYMFIQ
jgi:DNA polymerase III epsilon subunit-like protein